MEATTQLTSKQSLANPYKWLIVVLGVVAMVFSAFWLPRPQFDLRFLLLTTVMMLVSSRFSIQIPRVNTSVTISDTFIFLVLLLYGGFAAILVAAAEGLFSGLRISKTPRTVAFNSGMMAGSTFLTVAALRLVFGPIAELRTHGLSSFIAAVGTMVLVQYFSNSGICAIGLALKTGKSIWRTWQTHYMWTSITYLVGGAVAAVTSTSVEKVGLAILLVGAPIISIVYFTYHK